MKYLCGHLVFIRFLNKINNLYDLFSHKICCSINVQYKRIYLQLYILGAVNSTFFLRCAFRPIAPYTLYYIIIYNI